MRNVTNETMTKYKQKRIVDGKLKWVVIDEIGDIINRYPNKEELKSLDRFIEKDIISRFRPRVTKEKVTSEKVAKEKVLEYFRTFYDENGRVPVCRDFDDNSRYPNHKVVANYFGSWNNAIMEAGLREKRYNSAHSCDRCGKSFEELEKYGKYPVREYDEMGNWTGNWDCPPCYRKYDPNDIDNIMKKLRNCRTGNQDKSHGCTKGDITLDLACELYGYENLNKIYDNYNTEIDCRDEKTGLLYQVQGRQYNQKYGWWCFSHFDREQCKDYKDMICFCKSNDGTTIERIYRFPCSVIKGITTVTIVKNPSRGVQWYEEYMVKDAEELEKANEILQRILRQNKK